MTVITKPSAEKAKKQKEPIYGDETIKEGANVDVESGVEPRFVIMGARSQRVPTTTTICLFLTALLVMSIGVIGGMYLYRQFTRQLHFREWCTVPYNNLPLKALTHDTDFETLVKDYGFQADVKNLEPIRSLRQEFDIESEDLEKILVPDFGRGRKGRFIHDFNTNKTGIIDVNGHRCFIMPLNRERVFPPLSMMDLLRKIALGEYDVDTEVVRETMRVVTPPVTDFESYGEHIARECRNLKTYLLEKEERNGISKRSVSSSEAIFSEFAGSKISEIAIDTSSLKENEEDVSGR